MVKMRLAFILAIIEVTLAEYVDVRCTEAYCKSYIEKTGCPKLPSHCTEDNLLANPSQGVLLPSPSICNCCSYCITYLPAGSECVVGKVGQPIPASVCGPRLNCAKANPTDETTTCIRLVTPCMIAQNDWDGMRENGTLGNRIPRPECDERGDYIAAHCIPGSSCFCVAPNGERIFGETPYTSTETPDEMLCPCSKSGWRASKEFEKKVIVSRCLSDGKFDPLQCVDNKCFCVNPNDGSLQGKAWVHITDLTADSLECFDPLLHEEGTYLKICEQERYDVEQTLSVLTLDGYIGLGLRMPSCDADGLYSKLQDTGTTKVCVDPENNKIEDFEVIRTSKEAEKMDCNCARTRWVLSSMVDGGLVLELPSCCTNGNYARWQCRRGSCYCVDGDGNQQDLEQSSEEELSCYVAAGPCSFQN